MYFIHLFISFISLVHEVEISCIRLGNVDIDVHVDVDVIELEADTTNESSLMSHVDDKFTKMF